MASTVFDRETLLDLLVNVIPLGILLFFIVLFWVDNPFGGNPIYTYLQFAIVIVTFGSLLVLTYFSGRAVAEDEERREGTIWAELPPGGVPVEGETAEDELPGDTDDADESADDAADDDAEADGDATAADDA